ncbi:MAG: hypothetical protein ABSE41_14510 [Bacteroidota bacterium]|jgi:hypothetical protein
MVENQTSDAQKRGGPRTKAGKERSKVNALRHGGYSKSIASRSGPLREKAALSRKFYESLEREFKPEDTAETNCISSMADALSRKASVLRWEDVRIREEIGKASAPYKKRERNLKDHRKHLMQLKDELARLESEKETGLIWDSDRSLRNELLTVVLKQNKSRYVAWSFQNLTTAEERKKYFFQMIQWSEQALGDYLRKVLPEYIELIARWEHDLVNKMIDIKRTGERHLVIEKGSFLPADEVDQIMSLVTRCDRQFEKAVEFLMKYRAAKVELKERQRASGNQLEERGAGAQPA